MSLGERRPSVFFPFLPIWHTTCLYIPTRCLLSLGRWCSQKIRRRKTGDRIEQLSTYFFSLFWRGFIDYFYFGSKVAMYDKISREGEEETTKKKKDNVFLYLFLSPFDLV